MLAYTHSIKIYVNYQNFFFTPQTFLMLIFRLVIFYIKIAYYKIFDWWYSIWRRKDEYASADIEFGYPGIIRVTRLQDKSLLEYVLT